MLGQQAARIVSSQACPATVRLSMAFNVWHSSSQGAVQALCVCFSI